MILGIPVAQFVLLHVILSLIGIASGLIVIFGMTTGQRSRAWTAIFIATTILTSVTGFPIPPLGFDPPRAVGTLSLIALMAAIVAFYVFHLRGMWRSVYVITAAIALYLNCFVAIVQAFQKVPLLNAFAPTQSEPAFLVTQVAVLLVFIVLGFLAVQRFRPLAAAGSLRAM